MTDSNQNSNYTQEIQSKDNSSLHRYRTEIPNIIFDLGLDPYSLALYLYYKKVAGDNGECYQTKATIENNTQMSASTIKDRDNLLAQPFDTLGGKPLITITQRKDASGNNLPTLITIVDIWPDNFKILSTRFSNDGGGGSPKNGGGSPKNGRRRTNKEEPMIDRFDADGGESDLSMKKENDDFTELTPSSNRRLVFASGSSTETVVTHPVADLFRKYLNLGFSEETIKEAICKMLQKNPKLNGTIDAYFQVILKNMQNNEKKLKRSQKDGNKCTKPSNKPSSLQRKDRKIVTRVRPANQDKQE